ncbi:MAG: hypothetical protein WAN87_01065, partial [Thermoplasmata archaeon]
IDAIWLLRGFEGFVLLVGAGIAYASLRAYARTHDASIAFMGIGFAIVTVGAGLAGIVYELATHDLLSAWISSAALEAVGFSLILFSILRPRVLEIPGDGPSAGEAEKPS